MDINDFMLNTSHSIFIFIFIFFNTEYYLVNRQCRNNCRTRNMNCLIYILPGKLAYCMIDVNGINLAEFIIVHIIEYQIFKKINVYFR